MDIAPGKEFKWEKNGIKIEIPAGAIGGPVTLSIQASSSGQYQFPDNNALVSEGYWLALNPPIKFAKSVTITIQHYADADSAPFFVTAKCTQRALPYKLIPLSGGMFTYPDCDSSTSYGYGCIQVDHFSYFGICGRKSFYNICPYYLSRKELNNYELHITVTPNLTQYRKVYTSLLFH